MTPPPGASRPRPGKPGTDPLLLLAVATAFLRHTFGGAVARPTISRMIAPDAWAADQPGGWQVGEEPGRGNRLARSGTSLSNVRVRDQRSSKIAGPVRSLTPGPALAPALLFPDAKPHFGPTARPR